MNRALCRVLVAAAAAAAAASACSPSSHSSEAPPEASREDEITGGFQTSRPHYRVQSIDGGIAVNIPYVYRNATGDPVHFHNCNGIIVPTLEKRTGDAWSSAWVGASPACRSAPVVVPPDAEYGDTVRVRAAPDMHPQFPVAEIGGTYRLVWHGVVHSYHSDAPGPGTPLPQEERTSNEFTLAFAQ